MIKVIAAWHFKRLRSLVTFVLFVFANKRQKHLQPDQKPFTEPSQTQPDKVQNPALRRMSV